MVAKWLLLPSSGLTFAFQAGRKGNLPKGKESIFIRNVQLSWKPHLADLSLASTRAKSSDPSSCKVAGRRGLWGGLAHGWHVSRRQSPTQGGPHPSKGHPLGTTISHNHDQRWSSAWMTGKLVMLLQASQRLTSTSQVLLLTCTLILINPLNTEDTLLSIFTCRHSTALHLVCA